MSDSIIAPLEEEEEEEKEEEEERREEEEEEKEAAGRIKSVKKGYFGIQ